MILDINSSTLKCNQCVACCQSETMVALTPEEIHSGKYQKVMFGDVAHLPHKDNGDCVYLDNGKCSIYQDRPAVCREYDCRKSLLLLEGIGLKVNYDDATMRAAQSRLGSLTIKEKTTFKRQLKKIPYEHKNYIVEMLKTREVAK